jgi:hypothetical protein
MPAIIQLGRCIPPEVRGTVAQEFTDVIYETPEEIAGALREYGIVAPPDFYQLEYHDPITRDPLGMKPAEGAGSHPAAKARKPDKRVAIVSYDEKTGIQAIATTSAELPPKPARSTLLSETATADASS